MTTQILRRSQNMGGCAQGLSRLLPSGCLSTLLLFILSLARPLFVRGMCVAAKPTFLNGTLKSTRMRTRLPARATESMDALRMVEKAAEPRTLFVAADVAAAAVADVARIMMTDKQRHCKDYKLVLEGRGVLGCAVMGAGRRNQRLPNELDWVHLTLHSTLLSLKMIKLFTNPRTSKQQAD